MDETRSGSYVTSGTIQASKINLGMSPIQRQIGDLSDVIDEIDGALDSLVGSLEPALGPHRNLMASSTDPEDREELSEMASILENRVNRLRDIRNRIQTTTSRVEL